MEILKLVTPTIDFEKSAKEYITEFMDYNSEINGTGSLDSMYKNYIKWLNNLSDNLEKDKLSKNRVLSSTYFFVEDISLKILGMINIRYELNKYLLNYGGHIGYSIRPTERKRGYATKLLELGLEKCCEIGILKVLLVCNKDNIASAKTIKNNGGILENEILYKGKIIQRYWINLK